MVLPDGVEPVTWVLPDGTPIVMDSEPADCTEILWRTAPDYEKIIQHDNADEGELLRKKTRRKDGPRTHSGDEDDECNG